MLKSSTEGRRGSGAAQYNIPPVRGAKVVEIALEALDSIPVSYTHLTLPTIYSV